MSLYYGFFIRAKLLSDFTATVKGTSNYAATLKFACFQLDRIDYYVMHNKYYWVSSSDSTYRTITIPAGDYIYSSIYTQSSFPVNDSVLYLSAIDYNSTHLLEFTMSASPITTPRGFGFIRIENQNRSVTSYSWNDVNFKAQAVCIGFE